MFHLYNFRLNPYCTIKLFTVKTKYFKQTKKTFSHSIPIKRT
uniref:Uncharacterized protein n=1 Tax=Heterorhabditis bacteriophora TaxID=37862 RepID=A0A1I7WDR6_HETBA